MEDGTDFKVHIPSSNLELLNEGIINLNKEQIVNNYDAHIMKTANTISNKWDHLGLI